MLPINKSTSASFDVDPQRGFTPLCPEELPVSGGDEIAAELNAQATFARLRLVSKDCHPSQAPWIAHSAAEVMQPVSADYPELDIKWSAHCVVGSEGNRLIPGLPAETDYDLVVEKGQNPLMHPYGACFHDLSATISTGAIEWLKNAQIDTIIIGGLATDFCVKTTALQLRTAGFRVIINLAACRGVDPATTAQGLAEMASAGIECVTTSTELATL
jgi:nicotinamidase/pyrazinamidase